MTFLKYHKDEKQLEDFSSIEWLTTQAIANHKEGKLEDAIAFYLEAIELDTNQPAWVYSNVISLFAEIKNFTQGIVFLNKANKIYSNSDEICRAGGTLYSKQNHTKDSITLYKKAIKINFKQPYWVYLAVVEGLLQQDELEAALDIGEKSIELYSQHYHIYYYIGEVCKKLNKIDQAIFYLNKSIVLGHNFFCSYRLLSLIYFEQNRWAEAIEFLYKSIKLNSSYIELYGFLVEALIEQKQPDKAFALFQKHFNIKTQDSEKSNIFKIIHKSLEKKAKLLYDQIIDCHLYEITEEVSVLSEKLTIDKFEMYFWLAEFLLSQNLWQESIQCYRKCLQLKPNNSKVIYNLKKASHLAHTAEWIGFEDHSISSQADLIDFYAGHEANQVFSPYKVDIVVCVHNALEDVRKCLSSILCHTTIDYSLIVIDDGSEIYTKEFVQRWVSQVENAILIRNSQARGYTKAANQGLRASKNDYAILLNSDTIVTPRWVEKMVECFSSDPEIGIVGPLSNCASWQSVPKLFNDNGDWMINSIPKFYSLESYTELIEKLSGKSFPIVSFVNGFCYMIKRALIDNIGYLDEESFPHGYGEENDYSLRACKAGFKLAIADHTYVYHAKSKSFGHQRRKELAKQGSTALKSKHPDADLNVLTAKIKDNKSLLNLRLKLQEYAVPPII
ncbi:MAG: hypothetical protein RLZZ04_2306 [Cyanobacteriota bacterium]|jgi:GT2 family glycosyltransferase/tetratricopeptide (TPR) repeat protein